MADLDPTVWESAKAAILSQFVSIGDDINPYQEDYDSQTSYIKLVSSVITTPVENSSADVSCRAFIPPENFIADIDFSNRQYSRLLSVVYLCKVIIRKLMYVYLNNPLLLALLPMVLGLTLGIVIGNLWPYQAMKGGEKNPTSATDDVSSSGVRPSSKMWEKSRIRQDPSMVLLLVRRIKNLITKILQLFQEKIIATISLFLCLFLKDNKFVYYSDAYEKDQDDWEYNANDSTVNEIEEDEERDNSARIHLLSSNRSQRESGIPLSDVPQHIAVIMDGNRRYGRAKYGSATRGHWDGSKILVEFAKWCIAEGVSTLTVYAFSTENWNRHPTEVKTLMGIICKYCDELRVEALQRGISIRVLSTETEKVSINHLFDFLDYICSFKRIMHYAMARTHNPQEVTL